MTNTNSKQGHEIFNKKYSSTILFKTWNDWKYEKEEEG